ncbi:cyclophilin-like fold protein [Enterococcus gilvus]|jgi:hypothetical protein|uniref:cyclophilin-like fold protein n=1 Tax=Enterococcus gilvus TaxID=160453 RepID=UPI00345E9CFD
MSILRVFLLFYITLAALTACAKPSVSSNDTQWTMNGHPLQIELEDTEAGRQLSEVLPDQFVMQDLNGNEKYYTLPKRLPTSEKQVERIEAGDVMLYGNRTLVVFYRSFSTNYSYTRIGRVKNNEKLADQLGEGDTMVEPRSDERKE